jgi:nicotinate-nucleotide adenylyltransferase
VNVAFFGGSFNPPHIAHVLAASYARAVGFDKVLVVVVGSHAFGKPLVDFEHRFAMCQLAFAPLAGVEVSRIEQSMPQPNYTLHTLERLTRENPGWRMRLLVGSDVVQDLPSWYASAEVQRLAPLFVMQRVGHTTDDGTPSVLPGISSSEVRRRLAALSAHHDLATEGARDAQWLERCLPRDVLTYVHGHNLYRSEDPGPQ